MEKWLNIAILKHFASFPPIKFRTFSLSPHSPASGNISRPASSGEGLTSHSRYKKHRMASGAGDHTGAQTPQSAAKLHPPHGCLPSSDPRATLKMEATLQGGCHVPLSPTGDILPLKQGVRVLLRELRLHTMYLFLQVYFPQVKPGLSVFCLAGGGWTSVPNVHSLPVS